MVPAELRRRAGTGSHQGAKTGEGSEDILPARGLREIEGGVAEQELDLLLARNWLQLSALDRNVCGPHQRPPFPGNDENDAAVVRLGHQNGGIARQKAVVQDDMGAPAVRQNGIGGGLVHPAQRVGEDARCIHHRLCSHRVLLPTHLIEDDSAGHASPLFDQARHLGVVQHDGAIVVSGTATRMVETQVLHDATENDRDRTIRRGMALLQRQ